MSVIDGCCACGNSTDTALGFEGEDYFIVANLQTLKTPIERALHIAAEHAASGHKALVVLVCRECAEKASFPEPVRLTGNLNTNIPTASQYPRA